MNDPEKGGSAYLQQKISAARDALVEPAPSDADGPSKGNGK